MISTEQKNKIIAFTKSYHPSLIGIFGSYARNENTEESDLDILIDFEKKVNLLDIIGLEQQLSDELKVKVDLVTVKSLNAQLAEIIKKEVIRLI